MKIQQTYIYLLTFSAVILTGCLNVKSFRYSEIQKQQINGFDAGYKDYCKRGGDGYVSFISKAKLIDHYVKSLGAVHVGGHLMILTSTAALKLINKYF